MQVGRFKKMRNGMYKVSLDGMDFEIHEDLILKYELLLKKEISDTLIRQIEQENLKYKVYDIALKALKRKLRSKVELREILKKQGALDKDIDAVLNMLESQGYLNDSVYLESYIHDKILLSMDGPLKIKKDLIEKGFSSVHIEEKLQVFSEDIERERVLKIVDKYVRRNHKSLIEFRLKMKQYLLRLGYQSVVVDSVLETVNFNDEYLYQMEYDKMYRKLSKKYSGKDLESRIQQKLYQKGFRNKKNLY